MTCLKNKDDTCLEMLLNCAEALASPRDLDAAVMLVIENVRRYYQADRVYIFDIDIVHRRSSCAFEVCADGIEPWKEKLSNLRIDRNSVWMERFRKNQCILIENVDSLIENDPWGYGEFAGQGIRSLAAAPFFSGDQLSGFIEICNPSDNIENDVRLLLCMAGFIWGAVEKIKIVDEQHNTETLKHLALKTGKITLWEYDRECRTMSTGGALRCLGIEDVVTDMPDGLIRAGFINPECADEYRSLYRRFYAGEKDPAVEIMTMSLTGGGWAWKRVRFIKIKNLKNDHERVFALGVDITDQRRLRMQFDSQISYMEHIYSDSRTMRLQADLNSDSFEIYSNQEAKEFFKDCAGYSALLDLYALQILDPAQRRRFVGTFSSDALLELFEAGSIQTEYEYQMTIRRGPQRWVKTIARLLRQPSSNRIVAYVTTQDVDTEHISKELLQAVTLDYDYLAYIDAKNGSFRIFASANAPSTLPPQEGTDYDQALADYNHSYVAQEDAQQRPTEAMKLCRVVEELEKSPVYELTTSIVEKDGQIRLKKLKFTYLDKGSGAIMLSRSDITSLYRSIEENRVLREMSLRDGLTGLLNKEGFGRALREMSDEVSNKWLFFMDIDNFKFINDSLGHVAGDVVLKEVGGKLRELFPGGEVCRFGGDEFVMLMKSGSRAVARQRAVEICNSMRRTYSSKGQEICVSVSVGIFGFQKARSVDEMLQYADKALYNSKEEGKDRFTFYDDLE